MKIFFVRHGESISNANHIHAGNEIDSGLTDVGVVQAKITGKYMAKLCANIDINYIYSSPMKRALATAEIIKKEMGLDINIVCKNKLVEKSTGILAGMTHDQSKALLESPKFEEYQKLKFKLDDMDIINKDLNFRDINVLQSKYLSAESYDDVRRRGKKILRKIVKHKDINSNLIIVAHGTLINEIICGLLHIRELNWSHMLKSTFNCYLVIMEYNKKYFTLLSSPTNFFLDPNGELISGRK